ncbi:universal stress protein, UspA family [Psychroflexus torquis ATCC 700755]|uniref:Universal stress protein, UspA family n=2 Tax=Psychroflexus TaxID=83612 RepID=K4IW68_PSYTT|nr:universal stress protein, UspA family [Psychroflexus torquis ATCC 700755]
MFQQMKNILLPSDFSKNSKNAIEYAMKFFENEECHFYILNIQKSSEYITADLVAGSQSDSVYDSIAKDSKTLIHNLVKALSKENKSQAYTFHELFDYDDFVSAIKQAVKINAIDLIIMGNNGASDTSEVIFGSNTLQVIRHVDCPALTVPEHYSYSRIKEILFSMQNEEELSFKGMDIFKDILTMHKCRLNVLELDDTRQTQASEKVDNQSIHKLFLDYPYTYFHLNTIPGLIALNTTTQLLKIDLHAVSIEKETFLKRLLFGSDTSQLAYGTHIPLLFLHKDN